MFFSHAPPNESKSVTETSLERVSLAARLRNRIKREGPITFRDWMEAALYDPEDGYYCRADRQRWGRAGDYRTSPERSPLFAATFAGYFSKLYEELNSPEHWTIVEVGAGAGDFAERMLETLERRFPDVFSATCYIVDEVSRYSLAAARRRLARFGERVEFGCFKDLNPIEPGILFSNELLDAFPVNRVTLRENQLKEFYVGLGDDGQFGWIIGELSTPRLAEYFDLVGVRLVENQIAEVNLALEVWLEQVAAKLRRGYIVTVDYGAETTELYSAPGRRQGTLRAFHRHQFVDDVFAHPGEQDITTTVDWTLVKRVGEQLGFETVEFERQDRFLLSAGLLEELVSMTTETRDEVEKSQLRTAAREMILPGGMASSFQVLVQKRLASRLLKREAGFFSLKLGRA